MAMEPFRGPGDARGASDRLFAQMPGAPAALVLLVAARGRLGHAGPGERPVARGRRDAPRSPPPVRSCHAITSGSEARTPGRKTRTKGGATAKTYGAPHRSVGTGGNRRPSKRSKQ